MGFDLVDSRRDPRSLEELLDLLDSEVAHANAADLSCVD